MRPLIEDSYQQQMLRKIALRSSEDGFPKYTDFGVDKESVEDYLSEKQDVLNLRGSQTRQFTVVGCLILIPALIASGFDHTQSPFGDKTSLVAMLGGVVLAACWWGLNSWRVNRKLKAICNQEIEAYLRAVEGY